MTLRFKTFWSSDDLCCLFLCNHIGHAWLNLYKKKPCLVTCKTVTSREIIIYIAFLYLSLDWLDTSSHFHFISPFSLVISQCEKIFIWREWAFISPCKFLWSNLFFCVYELLGFFFVYSSLPIPSLWQCQIYKASFSQISTWCELWWWWSWSWYGNDYEMSNPFLSLFQLVFLQNYKVQNGISVMWDE